MTGETVENNINHGPLVDTFRIAEDEISVLLLLLFVLFCFCYVCCGISLNKHNKNQKFHL